MMDRSHPMRLPQAPPDFLRVIHRLARHHFNSAPGSHDWEHTLRVHRLCCRIGPAEKADMAVLEAAAYLHDIGRTHQDSASGSVCHAANGARLAATLIADMPMAPNAIDNILHCIRSHRFRDDQVPSTVEARCLFDADKLDAIGAIGIARAYQFAGELGARLHNPDVHPEESIPYSRDDTGYREYVVKLAKIKERMMTHEGRRMAEARHAFMVSFFDRFMDEYAGRC